MAKPYKKQPDDRVVDDLTRPGMGAQIRASLMEKNRALLALSGDSDALVPVVGAAPVDEAYVTIGNTSGLTAERALTGTANQITVTDNGADSTVVLSTPQNIDTAADVIFNTVEVRGASGNHLKIRDGGLNAVTITIQGGTGAYSLALPTAAGASGTILSTPGAGILAFATLATLGIASTAEQYITLAASATLASERALAGTSNQITLTDNGAGSTLVLSTPQNLHTATIFQVAQLGIGAAASSSPAIHIDVTGRSRFVPVVQSFATSQANYDIGSSTIVRLTSSTAGKNLQGFTNGIDGRIVFVINDGGVNAFDLRHNTGGTAANRFYTSTLLDCTIGTNDCKVAIYDGALLRWRVFDWMSPSGTYFITGLYTWYAVLTVDRDNGGDFIITGNLPSNDPQIIFTDSGTGNTLTLSTPTIGGTNLVELQDFTGVLVTVGNDAPAVAAGALGKVDLIQQAANIATTNLSNGPPNGMYLVEVYLHVEGNDATAGTLAVVIGWSDRGGATTNTVITGFSLAVANNHATGRAIVVVDSGDITYAVTITGIYGTATYNVYARVIALG